MVLVLALACCPGGGGGRWDNGTGENAHEIIGGATTVIANIVAASDLFILRGGWRSVSTSSLLLDTADIIVLVYEWCVVGGGGGRWLSVDGRWTERASGERASEQRARLVTADFPPFPFWPPAIFF